MPASAAHQILERSYPSTPDVPVARPYMPSSAAVLPYLQRMDAARWYSNFGPLLQAFEARLRLRFDRPTAVATVVNGTQALTLALQAMDVTPGFCAMPAWTFVATAHAVIAAGLTPWFVDVDPDTWMMTPDSLRGQLPDAPGPVTAAIPVAAFGRPCDLEAWAAFRRSTGIPVLADAAAAFDAVDSAPVPVVVSLHATKALGVGEGGFVASEDAALIDRVRALTTYGFRGSRESLTPATNAKLSEYACAVGLAALDQWLSTRMHYAVAAQRLRMALTSAPKVGFQPGWGTKWVSSTCIIHLPAGAADTVAADLARRGVDTRRWWGEGCHRSPAFQGAPCAALPITDALATSTLGTPYAADMDDIELERVASALIAATQAL